MEVCECVLLCWNTGRWKRRTGIAWGEGGRKFFLPLLTIHRHGLAALQYASHSCIKTHTHTREPTRPQRFGLPLHFNKGTTYLTGPSTTPINVVRKSSNSHPLWPPAQASKLSPSTRLANGRALRDVLTSNSRKANLPQRTDHHAHSSHTRTPHFRRPEAMPSLLPTLLALPLHPPHPGAN